MENAQLGVIMAMAETIELGTEQIASPPWESIGHDLSWLAERSGTLVFAVQEQCLVYVNAAVESLLGYTADSLVGKKIIDFVIPEQQKMFAERVRARQLGDMSPQQYELGLTQVTGQTCWVDLQVSVFHHAGRTYSVGLGHDISERKQAEQKLQNANQALEEFASMVAHDLRHPINAIGGFGQALQDLLPAEKSEEHTYLKRVRQETQRMSDLIDCLLQMSQIPSTVLQKREVDLSRLFRSVVRDQLARHPGPSLELIVEPALVVLADPDLLRLVLTNLIDNALKFSTGAQRLLELGSVVNETGLVFFVRDQGMGFNQENATEIFRPLHRLNQDKDVRGYGLGLATVQRIIERHGGRVWAESRPGSGAAFFFSLDRD